MTRHDKTKEKRRPEIETRTTMMTKATVSAIAIGSIAVAGTVFHTTTNDDGSMQYQLVNRFTLNFDLCTIELDSDLNGTVDSSSTSEYSSDYDGFNVDPEHFVWDSANGTLASNGFVPGPLGMLAFAGFGLARRRRNR